MSGRCDCGEPALLKYRLPMCFNLDAELLKKVRIEAIKRREEMCDFKKKTAAGGDREYAKFFKEEEADARKEYNAVCLLLPFYTQDVGGDCPQRDLYAVGPELFGHLCRVEIICMVD
jgi:hypothetical protein